MQLDRPASLYSPAYSVWCQRHAMQMEQTQQITWWQWPLALVHAFLTVVRKGPTPATEGGMAALVGLIGLWLLLPFDTLTSAAGLREMLHLASEGQWGWALVALSLFKMSTLGWLWLRPRSRTARRAQLFAAGLILALWVIMAAILGGANWRGLAFPLFGAFATGQLWIFIGQGHRPHDDH